MRRAARAGRRSRRRTSRRSRSPPHSVATAVSRTTPPGGSVREDAGVILHLRAAVEQLYAVTPGEFTALRSQLAKQARSAGDVDLAKAVTALRKPTVAAWALNHFVR